MPAKDRVESDGSVCDSGRSKRCISERIGSQVFHRWISVGDVRYVDQEKGHMLCQNV